MTLLPHPCTRVGVVGRVPAKKMCTKYEYLANMTEISRGVVPRSTKANAMELRRGYGVDR